jgi:hypothetical protein
MELRGIAILAAALLACTATRPALAQDADEGLAPYKLDIGDGWQASLGGDLNLTAYGASQPNTDARSGGTASLFAYPKVEKLFANGWRVGFSSALNLYHDWLSGDNYGNDFFEKAYVFLETPYGRAEIGQADGAAYGMAVTGPVVADAIAIDDANIVFFKDPASGAVLTNLFNVRTGVFTTANAAKISYYSPRLFGIQIGASFTPELVKQVVPFAFHAPSDPDRQENIVEGAINYTGYFGNNSVGAYAGIAAGHNAERTAGHDDAFDWALGSEIDHDFGNVVWAVGGAFRQSNGYTFDPDQSFRTGTTHAVHATTRLTMGKWIAGFEYSEGIADAEAAMPRLDLSGYEISGAYTINDNMQLTVGYQHQRFTRRSGVFYDGRGALDLDAGFLYLQFHV